MDKKAKHLMNREEYDKWFEKLPKDICTFCQWEKYQIILREFDRWVWIANIAPYWRWHTMIISKRHFVRYSDMTFKEAGELPFVFDYAEKKILDSELKRKDGSLIEKVVYFWRFRANRFDPVSGTVRPDHFHIHLSPDKDHLWDPIVEKSANEVNVLKLRD